MKHRIGRLSHFAAWILASALLVTPAAPAAEPLFQEDFSQRDLGEVPDDYIVIAGYSMAVRELDGNRFLEIPEAPVESYGLMFGPARREDWSAQARFYGTRLGRKFPAFGISLNTVNGYRLQVAPAKRALEILKGDLVQTSIPFEWQSGSWTHLRIQLRKTGDATWTVSGRAWTEGTPEPDTWHIEWEETTAPIPGRAIVWGMPFSGTPIRVDDIRIFPLAH
ncbi:MAG: hypothetical protein KF833_07790 [Verrucomicrobiae bacterium]|nr:hypothetical protein [Verrucomicrobiae bacterium]